MTDPARTPVNRLRPDATSVSCDRVAALVLRGVQRLMRAQGFSSLAEIPLANSRRADVMALGPAGELWIVEIKSSIADFRADHKWTEYGDYCDALYFAVAPDFPHAILPPEAGLILADAYAGEIIRPAPTLKLASARRKAVTASYARLAALRLQALTDPGYDF